MSIFDLFKKLEAERPKTGPVSWIVCGLGNPGARYEATRHNAGFLAADELARRLGVRLDRAKFHGLCAEAESGGARLLLLEPATYMNESGVSVRAAMDWYKLGPERLVVLCDDLELPVGRIRVRPKGSDGGHNGLKSVIAHAGTADFARVRIGIGRPADPAYQVVDWVLGRFSADEAALVRGAAENAAKAALDVIGNGAEHAMNLYNGKR